MRYHTDDSNFYDSEGSLYPEPTETLEELEAKLSEAVATWKALPKEKPASEYTDDDDLFFDIGTARFNLCNLIERLEELIDLKLLHQEKKTACNNNVSIGTQCRKIWIEPPTFLENQQGYKLTNCNIMAKKEASRSIVLNVMYNGKYLNENMGHEVINLFKDDNDRHFLYLSPYGNFSSANKRKVEKMLMVIPVPKKNMFEVVALATGLTEVFKPVKNYNPMLDRNKETEANRIAYEKVRRSQLEYIEKNEVTYGTIPLDQLFGDDKQQAVYITYQAEQVLKPKKRIFISFQEGRDTETDESLYLSLGTYKQTKMAQKQYITLQSDTDNKLDWYLLNDRVLENAEWWEEYPSDVFKLMSKYKYKEESLFDICGIADSELAFSNALAHYIKKYTYLFKDVFGLTSETVSVEREHEYIDILIKDGDKRIIVENKIHSAINRKKSDKAGESQLNRYWEQLTEKEGVAESNVTAFILCPEYTVEQMKVDKGQYKHHEKYTIISYKTLWNSLKDADETHGDAQFGIFVDALKRHTYCSVPESKYEEMKSLFFRRIIDRMVAGMNL